MLRLYDRAVDELGPAVASRHVDTHAGRTHLLTLGPVEGPPLVIFQGGNFLGPLTLPWFRPLAANWRLYVPDAVGHPGKSAETRLSPSDGSYGEWAADVLAALSLERVPIIGLSYGAGITLRLAEVAPDRIQRAVLMMPAGIIGPPLIPLLGRIVPWLMLYRFVPSRRFLIRAAEPMFTSAPEEQWLEALGAVFRHVRLETGMPRPTTVGGLRDFQSPVLVIAGEDDPFFPGRAVADRACEVIPNLAGVELLDGVAHIPDEAAQQHLIGRLTAFFRNGDSRTSPVE